MIGKQLCDYRPSVAKTGLVNFTGTCQCSAVLHEVPVPVALHSL